MGAKMSASDGRIYISLHEGKPLLSKVLHDTPGCDPQAFNKLYDRDEFSNTVLTSQSQFSIRNPWAVLWLAIHIEDVIDLFGNCKDPLGARQSLNHET